MQCKDKDILVQQLDNIDRFLQVNTPKSGLMAPSKRTTERKTQKLDLPTFSSDYSTSNSLFDLFNRAARTKSSLQDSQKLQYLNARQNKLLLSVTITDANYAIVIMMLVDRYHYHRMIGRAYMHAIAAQKLVLENA